MADRRPENGAVPSDQLRWKEEEMGELDPIAGDEKRPKRNKYAFGCAILASMTSILLGYGMYLIKFSTYIYNSNIFHPLNNFPMHFFPLH